MNFFVKIFAVVFAFLSVLLSQPEKYAKVRIYINSLSDMQKLMETGVDLECQLDRKNIDRPELWVSYEEINLIRSQGLNLEILIDDWHSYYETIKSNYDVNETFYREKYGVQGFQFGSMGGFYTLNEVIAELDTMKMLYPNIITERQPIGYSIQNRPIWMVKISDNPDINENEPQVLYTALTHAREPQGMMTIMYYMYYLLERYNIDPEVTYLINNREIYFIPVVNPDGYEYNRTTNPNGGGLWRKNRRDNGGGIFGVDLNRNFGPFEYWNHPNGGSSTSPSSETYRGTAPFSEPETATLRDFVISKKIRACLNYHTYSNLLIYPYGALQRETPDSAIFREFARDMTAFNGYVYGTDIQTVGYNTRGNSDDYMYDGDPITLRPKIFAMTPEVGSSSDGFWPPQSRIYPLAIENLRPNIYYTWIAGDYPTIKNKILVKNGEHILPGDTVRLIIELKNKGLGNAYNVNVNFTSLSTGLIILANNNITIDSLAARTTFVTNTSPLIFRVAPYVPVSSSHKLVTNISINGVVLIRDTINLLVGQPTLLLSDNFENGISNWQVTTPWNLTGSTFKSPIYSMTDSPTGQYGNNVNVHIVSVNNFDLTQSIHATLEFWTRWDIEASYDFAQVRVSTNNGGTWIPLRGKYTRNGSGRGVQTLGEPGYDGTQTTWVKEEMSLNSFLGKNIRIQFLLKSDGSLTRDGWYIDDVTINSYNVTSNVVTATFSTAEGWNLVSVPVVVDDFRKGTIFPQASSFAYAFENGYKSKDTLKNGEGYWLKFNSPVIHNITGNNLPSFQVSVKSGWNLIGNVNGSVAVSSITTNPPNLISSAIYGYNNGYVPVSSLEKGKGYWVKVNQNGYLNLNVSSSLSKVDELKFSTKIIIKDNLGRYIELYLDDTDDYDKFELPPVPPQGILDARLNDNYLIGSINDENVLSINNAVYPITIEIKDLENSVYTLRDVFGGKIFSSEIISGNSINIHQNIDKFILAKSKKQNFVFDLSQNYPNPFNQKTKITFTIPEKVKSKLVVYDILGNEVALLIDQELESGKYSFDCDASSLVSGVYFYKLSAGNFVSTKKMILIK